MVTLNVTKQLKCENIFRNLNFLMHQNINERIELLQEYFEYHHATVISMLISLHNINNNIFNVFNDKKSAGFQIGTCENLHQDNFLC